MNSSTGSAVVCCPGCSEKLVLEAPAMGIAADPVANGSKSAPSTRTTAWEVGLDRDRERWEARIFPWPVMVPAILVGIALFVSLVLILQTNQSLTNRDSVAAITEVSQQSGHSQILQRLPSEAELTELFTKLTNASSLEQVNSLVREADHDALQKAFEAGSYTFTYDAKTAHVEFSDLKHFFIVHAQNAQGKTSSLILQRSQNGLVLDWGASFVIGEMTLQEFQSQRPSIPVKVRVLVTKIEYYNDGFDSKMWQSYSLSFEGSDDYLIGYVPRQSFMIHQLEPFGEEVVNSAYTLYIMVPKIKRPDDRLIVIDSVVSKGWILQ